MLLKVSVVHVTVKNTFTVKLIFTFLIHLRRSPRIFEEGRVAKKPFPAGWGSRPRISSVVFPTPPSLYACSSDECDSPQLIPNARSQNYFPTESIPFYKINHQRKQNDSTIDSLKIPVISIKVNEKILKQPKEQSGSSEICKINCEKSKLFRESKNKKNSSGLGDTASSKGHQNQPFSTTVFFYEGKNQSFAYSEGHRDDEHTKVKSFDDVLKKTEPIEEASFRFEDIPKRYTRSSLKKQKTRLQNGSLSELNKLVPNTEKNDCDSKINSCQKSKIERTAEIKRKTFLRKISLQDTHLNYNQDYWLELRKSARFHKSIDLGCFGGEQREKETTEVVEPVSRPDPLLREKSKSNQTFDNLSVSSSSKSVSKPVEEYKVSKWDSDPLVFSSDLFPCQVCDLMGSLKPDNFGEKRLQNIEYSRNRNNWLSNENIPLFTERNGFIETDFEGLEEEWVFINKPFEVCEGKYLLPKSNKNDEISDFPIINDFNDFYEINLSEGSQELETCLESPSKSNFIQKNVFDQTFIHIVNDEMKFDEETRNET